MISESCAGNPPVTAPPRHRGNEPEWGEALAESRSTSLRPEPAASFWGSHGGLYRQLSPGLSTRDGVDLPGAGNAFEFVLTAVLEVDARTRDEILDRRGHEHFSGPGER